MTNALWTGGLLTGLALLLPGATAQDTAGAARRLDFGMVLKAEGSGFRNLQGSVTVPADWPGQQRVRVLKQDLPPGTTISFKSIDEVGRQMLVRVPLLQPGAEVRIVVTFEVELLRPPDIPHDVAQFTAPDPRKSDRKLAVHLAPSPKIESDNPQVRKAAEAAASEANGAWDKVRAVHQWVCQNIAFAGGLENVQTCMQTLDARHGVCAEKNSLAVAMLRALGIPARLVRIPGHCYYEVYLLDGQREGHWLSADASHNEAIKPSAAALGVILQKGDNVSVISPTTKRRISERFLAETIIGLPTGRGGHLAYQPITPAIAAPPLSSRSGSANAARSE